jgi:type VI protein secretion system component Hcp
LLAVFWHIASGEAHAEKLGMAKQFYLGIDSITGDVKEPAYIGWILIESYDFPENRPGGGAGGGGTGRGGASKNRDLVISAKPSSASVALMRAAATGKNLKDVVIEVLKDGELVARITLTDAMVSSFRSGSFGANSLDTFTLSFSDLNYEVGHHRPDYGE